MVENVSQNLKRRNTLKHSKRGERLNRLLTHCPQLKACRTAVKISHTFSLHYRMDIYNKENLDLKRKLDSLESSNRSLLTQLRSLQTLVAGKMPKPSRTVTTQTSSCLMVGVN